MGNAKILQFPGPGKRDGSRQHKRRNATSEPGNDNSKPTPAKINERAEPFLARIGEQDDGVDRDETQVFLDRDHADDLMRYLTSFQASDPRSRNIPNIKERQRLMSGWTDQQLITATNNMQTSTCSSDPSNCHALIYELMARQILRSHTLQE